MQEISVQVLSVDEIRKYLKENTKSNGRGFAVVTTPLKVWKQTFTKDKDGYDNVIVALEIPAGAKIYSDILDNNNPSPSLKIRASEAKVVKQFNVGFVEVTYSFAGRKEYILEKYKMIKKSKSIHNSLFTYETGKTVVPTFGFSEKYEQCDSGIHFFVNLSSALEY